MPNVTVRQLQVFVEAAEMLSFARVAERLRLTPSAVSFQIRQIEALTGFSLFERIGRRVALTEAGSVLLGYAHPVLQTMHDMDAAMLALKGIDSGRVTLGLVSTAKYIVPHIIARFRKRYPGVTVLLREGNRSTIYALLASGAIDFAITGQPPPDLDFKAQRFATHPSIIISAPAAAVVQNRKLRPEELRDEWFIMREEGSGTRSLSDAFFRTAGFAPRIAMETSSNEMIKQAVMAGMGLALISQHTINLELSLGLLSIVPVEGFPVMRHWFGTQRRTSSLLPVHAALHAYLIEQGQTIINELCNGFAAGASRVRDGTTTYRRRSKGIEQVDDRTVADR
jgi:DNA-binding transcriptional LysR family regulator